MKAALQKTIRPVALVLVALPPLGAAVVARDRARRLKGDRHGCGANDRGRLMLLPDSARAIACQAEARSRPDLKSSTGGETEGGNLVGCAR